MVFAIITLLMITMLLMVPIVIMVIMASQSSSGGLLVGTPDCETAVLGSNPAISLAYSGLLVLRWAAILDGTPLYAVL